MVVENFNFNTFSALDIFNENITLKKAEINHRDLKKNIEDLRGYRNNAKEEKKEEINEVLMHANDLFE